MLHTKHYPLVCIAVFLWTGCHQQTQQEKSSTFTRTIPVHGPGVPVSDALFSTTAFTDAYTKSITQTFTVTRNSITLVTGKKGLKVTVNPAQLETIDGQPVEGDITVKMVELTTSEDLFRSNAATMSNGKLLASGGSYYVGMECNGKPLRIKAAASVQMEFPRIKNEDMELFYGDRDKEGNMNWVKADEPLEFRYTQARFTAYEPPFPDNDLRKRFKSKFRLFKSLKEEIYFNDKLMTIEQFAHLLQQRGVDKNIDTLLIPLYEFYKGLKYDPKRKYDTIKRYRLVSCKDIEDEMAWKEQERKITEERDEANRQYALQWRAGNTLEGKLQAYYAPSGVRNLGWINCDRFYQSPQLIETPVDIPYTFNDPSIQYFLIYKSINGLMSGRLVKNSNQQYVLTNLPSGEAVTIVAFTKQNGVIYNCKEDFTITAGKVLQPEFKAVSTEEMKKMFGSSIRM